MRTVEAALPGEQGESIRSSRCPQRAGFPGQPEISRRKGCLAEQRAPVQGLGGVSPHDWVRSLALRYKLCDFMGPCAVHTRRLCPMG